MNKIVRAGQKVAGIGFNMLLNAAGLGFFPILCLLFAGCAVIEPERTPITVTPRGQFYGDADRGAVHQNGDIFAPYELPGNSLRITPVVD